MRIPSHGVIVTIIDYTLSRAEVNQQIIGGGKIWDDDELFQGCGDKQFDVYRSMRDYVETHSSDDMKDKKWQGFYPKTNVMVKFYFCFFSFFFFFFF